MPNLDLLNHFWKRAEKEKAFAGYLKGIKQTRPFTLDAELADIVGKLATANPKAMRNYLRSARLPYPSMWIEAPAGALDQITPSRKDEWHLHKEAPIRVGWLLTQAPSDVIGIIRLALIPDEDGKEKSYIYPLMHMISPEQKLDMEDAFASMIGRVHPDVLTVLNESTDVITRLTCWGEGIAKDPEPLADTNFVVFEPLMTEFLVNPTTPDGDTVYGRAKRMMQAGLSDQMGDLAFIVAALALINEVPCKFVPYRPSGHAMIGGRMRPFMTSSIVSIEVPATRRRIREIADHLKRVGHEKAKKARHEVRGHWRHVSKLPVCEENHQRWERATHPSTGAPCWRMWIPHHERGDASLGWVRQTYQVSKGRGRLDVVEGEVRGIEYA